MRKIAISYRREDSSSIAGRIQDSLANHFGADQVFMDIDAIPFGEDFRDYIDQALAQARAVVLVIGPKWLGPRTGGGFRIADETDPVKIEVETALKLGLRVIPVLVEGATMPQPSDLPPSLAAKLPYINAAQVDSGRDYRVHIERVIAALESILRPPVAPAPTAPAPVAPAPAAPTPAAASPAVASPAPVAEAKPVAEAEPVEATSIPATIASAALRTAALRATLAIVTTVVSAIAARTVSTAALFEIVIADCALDSIVFGVWMRGRIWPRAAAGAAVVGALLWFVQFDFRYDLGKLGESLRVLAWCSIAAKGALEATLAFRAARTGERAEWWRVAFGVAWLALCTLDVAGLRRAALLTVFAVLAVTMTAYAVALQRRTGRSTAKRDPA